MKCYYLFIYVLIILFLFHKYIYDGTSYFKSSVDNNYYKVRNGPLVVRQIKANLLATLNNKLNILINSLPKSNKSVQKLLNSWNNGVSIKEIGNMESDAAYVINKKYMSFCLKSIGYNYKYSVEESNLLTYVGIHEIAHVMSSELGHGKEFIKNFEFLLNHAKKILYSDSLLKLEVPLFIPLNKIKTPDNYCGVSLKNSLS